MADFSNIYLKAIYLNASSRAESTPEADRERVRCVCSSLLALEQATRGAFPVASLAQLPVEIIRKYFRPAGPGIFEAVPALRARIQFTLAAEPQEDELLAQTKLSRLGGVLEGV